MDQTRIDPKVFRRTLGHYPTGVCVVTSREEDGRPVGMAVGSFTSVSLDPPLIGFLPDKGSTSWPKIERSGRFCVNVLAEDQRWLSDRFASKTDDKFEGVAHRLSLGGLPVLDDVVAWAECALYAVHAAGDHFIVVGQVSALDVGRAAEPLLFLRGAYGRFSPV